MPGAQAGIMRRMTESKSALDGGHPKVRIVSVPADQVGRRLDNFLAGQLKGVPKSRIYRICRKGEVRVNKGRVKPDYRLRDGDQVRIPPVRVAAPVDHGDPDGNAVQRINGRVVHEDARLLVLNKPAGMAVHGGSGISFGVIELMRRARPQAHYLELVHRLDRDTSGLLVIAKKRSALRELHDALRERRLHKRYLALVGGRWQGGRQTVDQPLLKNTLRSGERVVRVDAQGKRSITHFMPERRFADTALMSVDIVTGRTHQIRVHGAHIGHPLAGDQKYGDEALNRRLRAIGLKRLFLHAARLELPRAEGPPLVVEAPLGPELQQVLERLHEH